VPSSSFDNIQPQRVFRALGFRLSTPAQPLVDRDIQGRPLLKLRPELIDQLPAERVRLDIGTIELDWSWWEWWTDLRDGFLGGARVQVPEKLGVYEVKLHGEPTLLYIGRAQNLHVRVLDQLAKAGTHHSAARKIAARELVEQICVRWATTDRPAAVEEELLRAHLEAWKTLTKYTVRK